MSKKHATRGFSFELKRFRARVLHVCRLAFARLNLLRMLPGLIHRITPMPRPRLGRLVHHAPRALIVAPNSHVPVMRATAPKISIVTPAYRHEEFLERTIQSVLGQRYPHLEYFVQDGGSGVATRKILKRYSGKLTGWKSRPDNGQSHAINLGFARTSGEIMGWLNSDDLLLPGALATVANYFSHHPDVDVVYGNRLLVDKNDMKIGRWILPGHDNEVLSWADYIPQESLFWRRHIWDKVGGHIDESFRFAMDWDLLLRFRDAGARFAHIPRFLGAFRVHHHQKSSAIINKIGRQEMNRIRKRLLGRVPTHKQIRRAVFPFLLRHMAVDMIYGVKKGLGSN